MRRAEGKEPETRYYRSYTDDFVQSRNQAFALPEDYVWVHENALYRLASACLYRLARLFAALYCRMAFNLKIENGHVLKQCGDTGYFVYGNHTQPMGDAFIPVRALSPRRCHVVVSPANLGIPLLGPLLPMLGALPIANRAAGVKRLQDAVALRIAQRRAVVIYPEAHVWPWYTGIRPYSPTSFGFPVKCGAPCFAMTTTYQKRRRGGRPKITLYFDGPFYPDDSLPKRERKEKLRDQVLLAMRRRSAHSTCAYIRYEAAMD